MTTTALRNTMVSSFSDTMNARLLFLWTTTVFGFVLVSFYLQITLQLNEQNHDSTWTSLSNFAAAAGCDEKEERFIVAAERPPWEEMPSDKNNNNKLFLLHSLSSLMKDEAGVPLPTDRNDQEDFVESEARRRFCSNNKNAKCPRNLEVSTCLTCPDSLGWYSAVSRDGTLAVQFRGGGSRRADDTVSNSSSTVSNNAPIVFESTERLFQSVDIAMPLSCNQDDRLRAYARSFAKVSQEFQNEVQQLRLIVGRYQCKTAPNKSVTFKELAHIAKLEESKVVLIDLQVDSPERFLGDPSADHHEAWRILHQQSHPHSHHLFIMTDVDIHPSPLFLDNCMAYVRPGASLYVPFYWAPYNPVTVKAWRNWRQDAKQNGRRLAAQDRSQSAVFNFRATVWDRQHKQKGIWDSSSMVYAMSGADAVKTTFNQASTTGEIGSLLEEETSFDSSLFGPLNVVRKRDRGLSRSWYDLKCEALARSLDEREAYMECIVTAAKYEGNSLGLYVRYMKERNATSLDR